MNLLIVEDEKSLAAEIASFLSGEGLLCEMAYTGMEASEKIAINLYDFILLDLGLPDIDGLELLEKLREWFARPIIILTVRNSEDDIIKALDKGANDYLTKPLNGNILRLKVKQYLLKKI